MSPVILGRWGMKILIVDDHALIRDGLQGVLKKLKRGATVLEAADCRQAMATVESNPDIDLILLDLSLPDRDGFSVLTELRERYPAMAVAVLSGTQDSATVTKALELGAAGFIPKGTRREVMTRAFQLIFDGAVYVPPQILPQQADASQLAPATPPREGRPIITPAEAGLSERQLDVLALMMLGKSNKVICRALNLAEPTVKNHVTAILRALKVSNRTEAVIAVTELGWKLPKPKE
jgi:DNA-binding NarL/FixJ family response regulator